MTNEHSGVLRVLVADDEPTIRISLVATVESFGYNCDAVSSGEDALKAINENRYDIVISDWEMPGMSGPELCQQVRSANCSGYIYFMLLTTNNTPEHTVRGLEAGADDFLTKPFNPAELRVRMKIAERILALDTMDLTIFSLAKLAESRDTDTGAHLERVREYSRVLARSMKQSGHWDEIDEEFVRLMYATSPLHDIGKVAIPDSVLLKPGHLSDAEFEIMKTHAVAGAETLRAVMDRNPSHRFLRIAHDIARSHHERFDGTGYPDGLAGDEIPLPARIMAVADVYDALTSKRVYKDAMPHQVACSIIRNGSGTHFDPRIVLVFEQSCEEFDRIHLRINDSNQHMETLAA